MSPVLPSERLDGRHALVTGAGRGLGRACALAFAECGAAVTAIARSPGEVEDLAAEIVAAGGRAHAIAADVTDPGAVADAVAIACAWGGTPDVALTAAGTNRPGPSVDTPVADFDTIMSVNVRGTWLAGVEVARRWLAQEHPGSLIVMSSQMGSVGYPGRAPYCASKHAVDGLTRAWAVEWAPHRIRVNAIAPTFVLTPMTEPMLADPAFAAEVAARLPGGEIAELADVAGAAVYLAGDRARAVTGHVLAVDGGWTAW